MSRIAIVTDSASNLPPEVAEKYNIHILPLRLIWGEQALRDGVDITPSELYARMRVDDHLPTTSTFSPDNLLQVSHALVEEYDAIVGVFLAHELSATFETAQTVQRLAPILPLHVVDSRTAAMAEGFVVLEAARAAEAGATVEQVINRAQEVIQRTHLLATLETLEYLRRGGRIGTASAFLGSMIQMKPILHIPPGSGSVIGIARPRTWDRAIERMVELMAERVDDRPVHVAIGHGHRKSTAITLAETLRQRFDVCELYITYFTAVMGVHAGPVLSVSFYTEESTP